MAADQRVEEATDERLSLVSIAVGLIVNRVTGSVLQITLKSGLHSYIQQVGRTEYGSDVIRVLPGRYKNEAEVNLDDLLVGPTDFLLKSYFSRIRQGGDQRIGRFSFPPLEDKDLWFRVLVGPSGESPGWWLKNAQGEVISQGEYSARFPDVDQLVLPLDITEAPARVRWLIDVGWRPEFITSHWGNWYPDDRTGEVVKGTPGLS